MEPCIYRHEYAPDVLQRLKLDALENTVPQSMRRFAETSLRLQVLLRVGEWRVKIDECPDCGAKAPKDQPDLYVWRLHRGREILCAGGHTLTIRQLLRLFAEDEKTASKMLMRLGQLGNPSLTRFYVYEALEERIVSEDPNGCR
jgi:hypothetical protein